LKRALVLLLAAASFGCVRESPTEPVAPPPPVGTGHATPAVYVLNTLSETISRLDLTTGTMNVQAALAGTWANRISVADDGALLLVTNSGSNSIAVIAPGNLGTQQSISLGPNKNPWLACGLPDGRALVSNWIASEVQLVDVRHRTAGAVAHTSPGPEGFAVRGDTAFVACTNYQGQQGSYGQGHLDVVDLRGPSVVASVAVSTNPQDVVLDSTGFVHVVCTGDYAGAGGHVDVVDPRTLSVVASIPIAGAPGAAVQGADGAMWVAGFSGGVTRYDPATRQVLADPLDVALQIPGLSAIASDPSAHRIYVADFDDDLLLQVDADTRAVTNAWLVGDGPIDILVFLPN